MPDRHRSHEHRDLPDATVITGAAGWFGRALVEELLAEGGRWERTGTVRAVVGPADDAASFPRHPRLEVVSADVRDASTLDAVFRGLPDVVDVVHAAGIIHPASYSDFVEVNTRGTQNVAAAARRSAVRRFVHVSSNSPFGVNPHPTDRFRNDEPYHPYLGYGRSKMLAELRLLDEVGAGLDAVIVRPPWFYGPHQPARQTTFFSLIRSGRFPLVGSGRQQRSMVYVGNLVQGVVAAELTPTEPGRGWWIADAEPYALADIVGTVKSALADCGLDVADRQVRLPAFASRIAQLADTAIQKVGRYHTQLHVLGELGTTIACDISAARRDLGYSPDVDLAEGMRRSIRWCLAQGIQL